jgi:hypothetical protein
MWTCVGEAALSIGFKNSSRRVGYRNTERWKLKIGMTKREENRESKGKRHRE